MKELPGRDPARTGEYVSNIMRYLFPIVAVLIVSAAPSWGEEPSSPALLPAQKEELVASLSRENLGLREKVRLLEAAPGLTTETLTHKSLQRLRDIAGETRAQRQTVVEFEGFVTWMTANLAGYSKYLEAGSVAAGFAKVLPIPYAGQASVLTKFVSQGVLSLNAASTSIAKYLDSSQQFITRVDRINPQDAGVNAEIGALTWFANEQLLGDMEDVQLKLATTANISSSALAFLESLNHYVGSTDEMWAKTKSLLKRNESDKKEKSFLSESTRNLRDRAAAFNARLKLLEESAKKEEPLIRSLGAYGELSRELAARGAEVQAAATATDRAAPAVATRSDLAVEKEKGP
jgi:hypothetical protein